MERAPGGEVCGGRPTGPPEAPGGFENSAAADSFNTDAGGLRSTLTALTGGVGR
jgi:hypothetical protein